MFTRYKAKEQLKVESYSLKLYERKKEQEVKFMQ